MAEADDLPDNADDVLDPVDSSDPKSAKSWLALLRRGERAFEEWQTRCDNLDKWYANLTRLANTVREREFQLFWANLQVIGPSTYSRPPVPVVVPAFKDKRELNRTASELLERCAITAYRLEDIDYVLRLARDDLNGVARGVIWLRYDTSDGEEVCIEFVGRKDFLHDPARNWTEVDWVAKASWLTRTQARKRFRKTSGDEYQNAAYEVRKDPNDDTDNDGKLKARFWELWSKSANKVVWVAEGCDKLLDEGKPHLDLEGFFPCPRPAYATLQRNSLIPVPDMLFYKDQLEEINEITARIAALTQKLKLQGFYPAGAGEIGDAIEAAIKSTTNNAILIPISNWSMLGGGAAKDTIVWLPFAEVATVITDLIELRKQLIEDVYQITGLSDIMRGDTDPDETLGAQQLKSQYGSIRVHDKQQELVRIARDVTRIAAEIMAENFSAKTLLDMSQMELPTDKEIKAKASPIGKELQQLVAELKRAAADPEVRQMAQQAPDKAKAVMGAAQQKVQGLQQQLQQLESAITIDAVVKFLRDNRMRPFTLDIETDSTIAPDEAAQQKRATEFVSAVGGYLAQAVPMVEQVPQLAPVVSAFLKFVASQFRVGREIEGTIDEFADSMTEIASQPKGPSPETLKAQADAQATQTQNRIDGQKLQMEGQKQQLQGQLDAANVKLAQMNFQLEREKAQAATQLDAMQLKLDTAVASAKAANDQAVTDNEAIKHHSIEETKRREQDVNAIVSITDAQIAAKAENDGLVIAHQLETDSQLLDHAHNLELQANEQQHQAAMQDSANQAAVAQAASQEAP